MKPVSPDIDLPITIEAQPTQTTCGATCLAAVYRYWNRDVSATQLSTQIAELNDGGTLAVNLACDALSEGFDATIATYNLRLFDPTWFGADGTSIPNRLLQEKLQRQREIKVDRVEVDSQRFVQATDAYTKFLSMGGRVVMRALEEALIVESLSAKVPILCGLSATYLYQESREKSSIADDIGGEPQGHFVLLHGFSDGGRSVHVADPLHPNPVAATGMYRASFCRLASAILLGIVTYDANLLMIQPKSPSGDGAE